MRVISEPLLTVRGTRHLEDPNGISITVESDLPSNVHAGTPFVETRFESQPGDTSGKPFSGIGVYPSGSVRVGGFHGEDTLAKLSRCNHSVWIGGSSIDCVKFPRHFCGS